MKISIFFASLWNLLEQALTKGLTIITTLFLAFFLVPEEYALIAMLAVFIEFSRVFLEAGFRDALLRKNTVNQTQYSTIFFLNIFMCLFIYLFFYSLAPVISNFYGEPKLTLLLRVVLVSIFFHAISVIPKVILSRELNFKFQLKVKIPAAFLSSLVAISLAFFGYGVWALILQIISNAFFIALFLMLSKTWIPNLSFSLSSVKDTFKFSGYIFLDRMIQIPFNNMYFIVLPKFFAANFVGLYFFADRLNQSIIPLVYKAISNVTYPAMAKVKENSVLLKESYQDIVSLTSFLIYPLIAYLILFSESIFLILLPGVWQPAATYFQLLCMILIFRPISLINSNILKILGKAEILLKVNFLKIGISVIILLFTIKYGIFSVIVGQIIASVMNGLIAVTITSRYLDYKPLEQILDFMPSLIISATSAILCSLLFEYIDTNNFLYFMFMSAFFLLVYIFTSSVSKSKGLKIALEILHKKKSA